MVTSSKENLDIDIQKFLETTETPITGIGEKDHVFSGCRMGKNQPVSP